MNIKISKLIKFFLKPEKRVYKIDLNQINYRFNIFGNDEDIFMPVRDGKSTVIETLSHDFSVLGSDTEIYIPKR